MTNSSSVAHIPSCAWTRPIGLGWDQLYTVRYASNLDDGPWHGMPLGGFGAGCIGRSPRGDFNLWHIDGGEHIFRTVPACQFSLFEQVSGQPAQAYALCTEPPQDGTLSTWNWYPPSPNPLENQENQQSDPPSPISKFKIQNSKFKTQNSSPSTYHALYPRSWFVYRQFASELVCEQFSPIWAGNYQETSYPVAVFQWTAHNPTNQPITLSIMLTWQNMVGWFTNTLKSPQVKVRDDGSPVYEYQPNWGDSQGNTNQWLVNRVAIGCLLDRTGRSSTPQEGDGQWAILIPNSHNCMNPDDDNTTLFHHTRWNPAGNGAEIWQSFAADGSLPNVADETPAVAGEQVGVAIAIRFTLSPGETRQIPVILTWDFPITEFAAGVEYARRYTDFFGRNGRNAWAIALTTLKHYSDWQQQIQTWQQPILDRDNLPDWFKMALFNELYDLTDGGTLWSAATQHDPLGQFAVLECIDYRWYESLDVRLYGSFALLMLFPELDKAVLRAFARAIPAADDTPRVIGYYHTQGVASPIAMRKAANATPHDLGAPNEHPWEKTNYTSYQDCNLWKDLGCDFVLQVYRDFVLTGGTDYAFLGECWPAIVATLAYVKTFDLDGDGIPENSGAPDQTFDDWRLQGVSAYCGGLWLAALTAAIAIGETLEQSGYTVSILAQYRTWLAQARPIYQEKLWNGRYYRLDSDSGSNVIMADQLCGQFYVRLLGLPDIVPIDCIRTALSTIYDVCFLKFNQAWGAAKSRDSMTPTSSTAYIGAANGVQPDGLPVNPNDTHPLEVWTGINFGIAALLLQMGLREEAFCLSQAVVQQIYDHGLQFRTPEAITAAGTFRASHYLRAMAIWAIYGVDTGFTGIPVKTDGR